jgi:hypothetical protein
LLPRFIGFRKDGVAAVSGRILDFIDGFATKIFQHGSRETRKHGITSFYNSGIGKKQKHSVFSAPQWLKSSIGEADRISFTVFSPTSSQHHTLILKP